MRLEGKMAIITGAASGIGAASARLFVENGAKVCIADVDVERGQEVASNIADSGGYAFFCRLDIANEDDWTIGVNEVVARFGKLNVLVNNAAINHVGTVEETTVEDWDRVMEVNAKGAFLGTKAVIPHMRRVGGGSIINVSSGAGLVGQSWAAAYNASKAAVHLLAKSTAIQYARDGIRANSVHPGAIDTQMLAGSSDMIGDSEAFNRPMGRMGTPKEIAYGVVFLASDESSYMTGTELIIDGGKLSGQWRLADTPYGAQLLGQR
jgi:NAD(P)-dependent dehydrogenase (short-subunit alcohol dehydrogenase family)